MPPSKPFNVVLIIQIYFSVVLTGPHDKRDVTVSSEEWQPWEYIFTNYKHSRFPKPKYYWKFKGRSLRETERISISEDGNLYIAQVQEDDAGRYSFEIEITSTLKEKREDVILQVSSKCTKQCYYYSFVCLPPKEIQVGKTKRKDCNNLLQLYPYYIPYK